jgi:amino acid adenylation domain-containing protein
MEEIIDKPDSLNLPLSSNQERLWILAQQDKNDPGYNIQLDYYFEGDINIPLFRKSIELLFEKQHTLFSVFRHKDGIPYINLIPRPVEIELIDYSGFYSAYEKILVFAGDASRRPFDIENGPLYRIYLLKEVDNRYFFCLTVHHLIFDGFSRSLFVEELNLIYNNLTVGINQQSESLKYHSYDFSALEKIATPDPKEKEYIEFWKETLKDFQPELKLPFDFQRKSNPARQGRRESFQIPKETSEKLRAFSRESEATVFKTLLSIVGIFLSKCTGANDICIGIPVSNRRTYKSFKAFGFFVNTIPVRFAIDETKCLREHIAYSNDVAKKAIKGSAVPFDKIVNAVNPDRIPGLNPFFQVCFSWINNFTKPLDLGGVKGERITVPEGVSLFDLTFYMWENGDFIEGYIEYNSEIFKTETIAGLKNNFLILVDKLLENPNKPLMSLSMITDREKELIERFNDTATDYPREKTINQLFEEQVELNPSKKAVVYKESSLTYKELNEKSNQLACLLRNSGVRVNDHIGLMIDKSVNMIVGILGILKSGAAYVPLDPDYPAQRKNFILLDSRCRILVTQDKYKGGVETEIIKISLDSNVLSEYETFNIEQINTPDDAAYIIYTSGTTGTPKGTLIPHLGTVRLVLNTNCIDFKPDDVVTQLQAVVFDFSIVEIFGALLNGVTLNVIDKATLLDVAELDSEFTKNSITLASFSSALFAQIAESHSHVFRNLRCLLVGGDVLSVPHANKVRKSNPQLKLVNVYGPTENSCFSTYYVVDKDFETSIPIGKPISNSTVYIFDKNMNYQPIGIIGELYVGGDGLSKGYLNREDLNKTSFIDHPYYPGKRLYKTGDMARWLPDGNIEFHGRIDNQVKIRGFRIELKEIESVLAEMDGICEAVIKPVTVSANDTRLVAFLKIPEGVSIDFGKVSDHLRSKMPSYMVPSAYKTLTAFPMTINGKVDMKALNIDLSLSAENEKKISVRLTPTQQKIAKIWQDIVKTKKFTINDSFFDIGGSSLLAILAADKLEKEFDIKLSLRIFFDSPKIKSLAEHIDSKIIQIKTPALYDRQVTTSVRKISGEI